MKIPKTFVKENISDKDLKKILNLEEDKLFNKHMDRLVSSCDQFLSQAYGSSDVKYEIGEKIASKYLYTLENIENLSKRVLLEAVPLWPNFNVKNLGFYFSALINKIITENDTVKLTLGIKPEGIGSHLAKGKIVVDSSAGGWAGAYMTGGGLVILGNAGDYIGYEMINGIIIVSGRVGGTVGYQANGGEIYADDIESMIALSCKATVYKKGKKIWPSEPFKMACGKGIID